MVGTVPIAGIMDKGAGIMAGWYPGICTTPGYTKGTGPSWVGPGLGPHAASLRAPGRTPAVRRVPGHAQEALCENQLALTEGVGLLRGPDATPALHAAAQSPASLQVLKGPGSQGQS